MGLRGWTYGYDYYTAETSVAFHMYAIHENKDKRKKVKLFWENSNLYPGSAVQGMKRLNGIIGNGEPGDVFYNSEETCFLSTNLIKYYMNSRPSHLLYKIKLLPITALQRPSQTLEHCLQTIGT